MAETTTTTSLPAFLVSTMRSATRRIRSASDTEDPPYFCTTSATVKPFLGGVHLRIKGLRTPISRSVAAQASREAAGRSPKRDRSRSVRSLDALAQLNAAETPQACLRNRNIGNCQ